MSGVYGTGINMKHWKQRISDECPRYGPVKEDTKHILLCNGDDDKDL